MFFTYVFRDSSGTKKNATIEAASREAAFAVLRSQGISPLSIRETKGASSKSHVPSGHKSTSRKLFAWILVTLVAFAIMTWWYVTRANVPPPVSPKNGDKVVKVPKTAKAPKEQSRPKTSQGARNAKFSRRAIPPPIRPELPTVASKPEDDSSPTNATSQEETGPSKIAKTGTEELLMLVTPSTPGGRVPPLPDLRGMPIEKDMHETLNRVVTAEKGDDESRLERKLLLAQQKEEFGELSREGWKFADYLQALREKNNADADYLRDAYQMLDELYRDESVSDDEYKEYLDKVNATLRERGLPEIE